MSREESLQKPGGESSRYPWYYRDVPVGVIVGFVALVAIPTIVIEFRPIRTAPPVTVVAHGDPPAPWKSVLPNQLPLPSFQVIPEPPVIAKVAPRHSAVDAVFSHSISPPELPKGPALGLRYAVLKELPDGGFAPVDPRQDLGESDRVVIRFDPNEAGFLNIFERSAGVWQSIATQQVQRSAAYTFPPDRTIQPETASREFLVVFSRRSEKPDPAEAVPISSTAEEDLNQAGFVVRATQRNPDLLSFSLTLKYLPR
jgi:hypothetical protein